MKANHSEPVKRLSWLVLLWVCSVLTLLTISALIKGLMYLAGLTT